MQPEREHGSSTPQRTLPWFAHTFVASYQSFGANLDGDRRSPARHLPSSSFHDDESQRRPLSAAVGEGTFTVAVGFILVVGCRLTVGFIDGADSTELVDTRLIVIFT